MDFCSLCCVISIASLLIWHRALHLTTETTRVAIEVSCSQSNLMIIGLNISMVTAASTTDVGL